MNKFEILLNTLVKEADQDRVRAFDACRSAQRKKIERDADAATAAAAWVLFIGAVATAVAGGFIGAIVAGILFIIAGAALETAIRYTVMAYGTNQELNSILSDFDAFVADFEIQLNIIGKICCPGNPPFDATIPQCMLT